MNRKTTSDQLSFNLVSIVIMFSLLAISGAPISDANAGTKFKRAKATEISADEFSDMDFRILRPRSLEISGMPSRLSLEVACVSRHDSGAAWLIDEWLVGNELYKSYQDPTLTCDGQYPYLISQVHMYLQIATSATITIAIDLEGLDTVFSPGCPVPGELLFLSDSYEISFPGQGLYDVQIDINPPQPVGGPFFVGWFFGSTIPPEWHLKITTDNVETSCVSYNIWDTSLGYIDLGKDEMVRQSIYAESDPCYSAPPNDPGCFDFDGRLILFTSGTLSAPPANCCLLPGDINNSGDLTIGDAVYILEFVFTDGDAPSCFETADADGSGQINIGDAFRVVKHIFQGGPAPVCGTATN